MNKTKCKQAISYINPRDSFIEETVNMLEKKQKQIIHRKKLVKTAGIAGAAAAAIAIAIFAAVTGLFSASVPPKVSSSVIAHACEQCVPTETAKRLILNGSPVNYSSLDFGYTGKVEYPDANGMETMCLEGFSEKDTLMRSQLVIKGSVEDVSIKQYFKNAKTAIYKIRIDSIFYSKLDVEEGDLIIIEQELYGGSLCDTEFGLKPGGQYILPIQEGNGLISEYDADETQQTAKLESPYSIVYPFQPMIQATVDGAYIFFGGKQKGGTRLGWGSLVDENTVDVVMDVETVYGKDSYINNMKLRADDKFEEDFQALVDYYCSGADNIYDGGSPAIPYGSEISGEEATNTAESQIPVDLELSTINGDFNVIHKVWIITFGFWNTDDTITVKISAEGEVIDVVRDKAPGQDVTGVIEVKPSELDETDTLRDKIILGYVPQKYEDGTPVNAVTSREGDIISVYSNDELIITIELFKADAEELHNAPELGKGYLVKRGGDSYTLTLLLTSKIGCVITSGNISRGQLLRVAGSFWVEGGH